MFCRICGIEHGSEISCGGTPTFNAPTDINNIVLVKNRNTELEAMLRVEREAHLETQRLVGRSFLEREDVKEQLVETQAKLDEAKNEKLRCNVCNSPYGQWPDGVIRANRLEIELAETQSLVRELTEALERLGYHNAECSKMFLETDTTVCNCGLDAAIAKTKAVLPANAEITK